jgi:hypothetical protein
LVRQRVEASTDGAESLSFVQNFGCRHWLPDLAIRSQQQSDTHASIEVALDPNVRVRGGGLKSARALRTWILVESWNESYQERARLSARLSTRECTVAHAASGPEESCWLAGHRKLESCIAGVVPVSKLIDLYECGPSLIGSICDVPYPFSVPPVGVAGANYLRYFRPAQHSG